MPHGPVLAHEPKGLLTMLTATVPATAARALVWTGRVLSGLGAAFMLLDGAEMQLSGYDHFA